MREAEYYKVIDGVRIQCRLCPHACILGDEESGICRTRMNEGGTMRLPFYGEISSIAMDPVEKKPLRHFLPGTRTFSVGFWHCTMACPFCQNWQISQPERIEGRHITPEALVNMAVDSGAPSVSFTYSEPCLHIEYVKEAMRLAHGRGLKTILVTNGCILETPARDILALTDAANVDLKSWSGPTYHKILRGELEIVKNFIQIAYSACHLEVTSLLVPGVLDSPEEMEGIAGFLASVSPKIPLHITPYHPDWRWHRAPLPSEEIGRIAAPAFALLEKVHCF
jgi:pyruvate formate lyase activating enzyme